MTRDKTCHDVLLEAFKAQPNTWIKKVQFYVIAEDWSPETVGRELRTLEEDPKSGITVSYYKGKYANNLAQYCFGEVQKQKYHWENYEREDGQIVTRKVFI